MNKLVIIVLAVLFLVCFSAGQGFGAVFTIDFETFDLPNDNDTAPIPINYMGLTWSDNWTAVNPRLSTQESSPFISAYASLDSELWIRFDQPVTFLGSYASIMHQQSLSGEFYWEISYADGTQGNTPSIFDPAGDPGYAYGTISGVWENVIEIRARRFGTNALSYYWVDDIQFETSQVPVPPTVLLLASGLFFFIARQKSGIH